MIKESIPHDFIFFIQFLLLLFRRVVDKLEVQSIYRYIATNVLFVQRLYFLPVYTRSKL